ncbi:DUF456 domain-containing protein [Elongatibacter sediminis]|uniref:DUF456 domain-containing protein n=1 Tax=Elongatibacter sediminis TaxID=3119006 RepID=A0AAW9RI53_9GAMM
MDWTILWWLLVVLLVVAGLAGTVVPALPGVPMVFGGLLLGAWIGGYEAVGWWTLGLFAGLTALALLVDFLAGAFGARYAGAGVRAFWGATIGAIVGMFFGLPGIILGPFAGAVIGEVSGGRGWRDSGRAGVGAWLGMVFATAFKLAIAFLMIGWFVIQVGFGP